MTLPLSDGRVEVYKPGNSSGDPDLVVKSPDLLSVEIEDEIQRASGKAKISINNVSGEFAGRITAGDRLEFTAQVGGGGSGSTLYGDGTYGAGSYGGSVGNERVWSGLAGQPRYRFRGVGRRSVTVGAQPFVFGVMGSLGRKVDNAFRGETVDAIAKTILEDEASELDTSGINSFSNTSVDIEFDGTPLLSAMATLADQADALLSGRGTTVFMTSKSDVSIQWTATADDFGTWDVDSVDDELWNQIRVDGADHSAGDEQTAQSSYQNVSEGNFITYQLDLPKSEIDEVHVWTRTDGVSAEESLTVGIQDDISGAPSEPSNSTKDKVNKSISADALTDGGFTTFRLERTSLQDAQPWLILRVDGSTGVDIGVDGSGNPTFKAFYPYQILTQQSNAASIDEYRRREHRIKRDNITSATAAAQLADRTLARHADPRTTFESDCQSPRAHGLRPGQAIELAFEKETAVGPHIVTGRTDRYAPSESERNLLKTDMRLEQVETF